MSRRRRSREAPMPMSTAGLLRFFSEELHGVRVRPEIVVFSAVILIIMCIIAHLRYIGLLKFP